MGSWVSLAAIPPSLGLLVNNLLRQAAKRGWVWTNGGSDTNQAQPGQPTLQVVLPGYNLPLEDLGYYVLTLFAITVLHEFGHAAAARAEGIQVIRVLEIWLTWV